MKSLNKNVKEDSIESLNDQDSIYKLVKSSSVIGMNRENDNDNDKKRELEMDGGDGNSILTTHSEFNWTASSVFNTLGSVPKAITLAVADTFRSRSAKSLSMSETRSTSNPPSSPLIEEE